MTSRESILQAVRQNLPDVVPLPDLPSFDRADVDVVASFGASIRHVGAELVATSPAGVADALAERFPDAAVLASTAPELAAGTVDLARVEKPHDLADLDVFLCRGVLGVAENGGIWVPESNLVHRAAPFVAQHLAIALRATDLVWNLHQAYARVDVAAEGFGVWIAGPSKTADIEQSLVIGAHGARSLTVFLLDETEG